MTDIRDSLTYAIVTPVRNEEHNLPRLAACVSAQTVIPSAWVIVDNGSTDDTLKIAHDMAAEHEWIEVLEAPGADEPTRGAPVVRAFMKGLASVPSVDVIVKLDADVTFGSDYFGGLLHEFACDPALGMASGAGYQLMRGRWQLHNVTADHVWGPSRAYRWNCLLDVLPLEEAMGWDAVDEIKARLAGWTTRHVRSLPFFHHRPLGLRDGARTRQWVRQGRAAYFVGYRPLYLTLRALFRARDEIAALAMIWGYAGAAVRRVPRCKDDATREYVRRQQRLRELPSRAAEVRGRSTAAVTRQ